MEVMSSFKLDWTVISLCLWKTISFQMFGEKYIMSFTDFFVYLGLIKVEYNHTETYSQLHIDLPVHLSLDQVLTQTLRGHKTYTYGMWKASALDGQHWGISTPYYLGRLWAKKTTRRSWTSGTYTSSRASWLGNRSTSAMPFPVRYITRPKTLD